MKFGDPVIYKEFGQSYPALVVGSRVLEHHLGASGEELLNVVFVKEVKDGSGNVVSASGTSRESELVQFRHDIAHESHEFSEEAKAELSKLGLLPPGGQIPGGRWLEADLDVSYNEERKARALAAAKTDADAKTKADAEAAQKKADEDAAAQVKLADDAAIEREARIRLKMQELVAKQEEVPVASTEGEALNQAQPATPSASGEPAADQSSDEAAEEPAKETVQ